MAEGEGKFLGRRKPINDPPFYAIRKATYIILEKRPQLSLLPHHHICANKHNTLRKIAKSVNDLNVGLVYLGKSLFILPCLASTIHVLSPMMR